MRYPGIKGKTAFVTGAFGGIGMALVNELAAAGATVIATDLHLPPETTTLPEGVHAYALNVSDSDAVDALVAKVETDHGPISLCANVAGILDTGLVTETSDARFRAVFDVNLFGVVNVSRAIGALMAQRQSGALVTVSSNAAGIPRHGMAAYAASKAASTMFTRCLGIELAASGVRCNIIAPGSTLTPMQTGMWSDENGASGVIAGSLETYKTGIPLGKLATPQDIANAAMFLLSDLAGHITMADLYIDGGATQRG